MTSCEAAPLTNDVLRALRRQFAAKLRPQLLQQFVDDVMEPQRNAALSRQLLDRPARRHVKPVNYT